MSTQPAPPPKLASLRCLLAFFFAGVGALQPYFSYHSIKIGLTLTQSRIISIVAPIVAFFGPAFFGLLVDHLTTKPRKFQLPDSKFERNNSIRFVLIATILLSSIFYVFLLTVPAVQHLPPREPFVAFTCNERGAVLVQERKSGKCYQYSYEKTGPIQLTKCRFVCLGKSEEETIQSEVLITTTEKIVEHPTIAIERDLDKFFGSPLNEDEDDDDFGSGEEPSLWNDRQRKKRFDTEAEPSPPHICYKSVTTRLCNVFTPYTEFIRVNVTLQRANEEENNCLYNLGGSFSCRIPPDIKEEDHVCKVICGIEDAYGPNSVFQPSKIVETETNSCLTFWLYLTLRSLGDLFTAATISLLIGATLTAVRLKIGREFVFPSLTYAACAMFVQIFNDYAYYEGILLFGVFSVLSVLTLIFATSMPIGPPDWWFTTREVRMRHKGEFLGLLFVLLLSGMLWGPYYQHIPWHMDLDLSPTPIEMFYGGSLALGALLSIPFIWKADFIVDYCGYSNVLIAALTFYILRYTGLLLIENPWVLLITGSLEVFSLSLLVFSTIFYVRHLVPKHYTYTSQSLAFGFNFCLGNGLGCLIATLLSPSPTNINNNLSAMNNTNVTTPVDNTNYENPYNILYQTAAIFAAIFASIYFIAYHCCFKKKCLAPQYRKSPSNGTLAQGSSSGNGTYTPLRVLRHNGRHQQ